MSPEINNSIEDNNNQIQKEPVSQKDIDSVEKTGIVTKKSLIVSEIFTKLNLAETTSEDTEEKVIDSLLKQDLDSLRKFLTKVKSWEVDLSNIDLSNSDEITNYLGTFFEVDNNSSSSFTPEMQKELDELNWISEDTITEKQWNRREELTGFLLESKNATIEEENKKQAQQEVVIAQQKLRISREIAYIKGSLVK